MGSFLLGGNKTHLEPRTKIKTMKPCTTLDHARGCFSRGVRNKRAAESAAKRARHFTSDEPPTFFPRAKYSYEKRKKETGLDWPISQFQKQPRASRLLRRSLFILPPSSFSSASMSENGQTAPGRAVQSGV
jgi:hypothetical protein